MNQESKYWYLSQFNLIKRLNRKDLIYLCDNSLMKNYNHDNVLVHQYDHQQYLYFLKKGTLKLSRINEEGEELLTYLIPKGSIFGLTQLLDEDYRGNEKVVAMQRSLICKVDIKLFRELMEKNKTLNNHILKLSGLKIKKLENRLEDIIFKTAEVRIQEFVQNLVQQYGEDNGNYYEASLFLTNKDIAGLTSTNRQKVNQVMNAMKKEGRIDFDKKTIRLYKR